MSNSIGPLTEADELFCHQTIDTFATVGSTDLSWTEKVCAMAAARDGSLQLGFGLGKYTNRNVIDAYAGTSRGVEQTTVRASRELAPRPNDTTIGPIRYEVVDSLRAVRFSLEPSHATTIAFEWLFESTIPPQFEERTHIRDQYRTSAELVRYHQIGVCSGWVEIDGVRHEVTPDTWVSTRDHSWGVRYGVGQDATDLKPSSTDPAGTYHFFWAPSYMQRSDGTPYGVFLNMNHFRRTGFEAKQSWGTVEHVDGRVERIVDLVPDLRYDPVNRRLLGGRVHATMSDGSARPLTVEAVSDTGFHLGTGLYFGFDGHHHGEWRGRLNIEGERIPDCSLPEVARRVHQIRDTVVRVTDPLGGGVGYGNWQPIITGAFPDLGLDAESSFM